MAAIARENYPAMRAGADRKRGIRAKVAAYRRAVLKHVDTKTAPHAIALVDSAAASYASILQLLNRLSAANPKRRDVVDTALTTVQAEFRRTLRLLGLTTQVAEDDHGTDEPETLADIIAEHENAEKAREATPDGERVE